MTLVAVQQQHNNNDNSGSSSSSLVAIGSDSRGTTATTTAVEALRLARRSLAPQVGPQLRALCAALFTERPHETLYAWVHCAGGGVGSSSSSSSSRNALAETLRVLLDVVLCAPLDFVLETRRLALFGEPLERRTAGAATGARDAAVVTSVDTALLVPGTAGAAALRFFIDHAPVLFERVDTVGAGATQQRRWHRFVFPSVLANAVNRGAVANALASVVVRHAVAARRLRATQRILHTVARTALARHVVRLGGVTVVDGGSADDDQDCYAAILLRSSGAEACTVYVQALLQLTRSVQ